METLYTNRQLRNLLLPLLVEQLLAILVGMADTVMVSSLGDAAVSGVSLVDQICNVIISLFAALATGGAVVSAQLLGAKRQEEACRVSNQLTLASLFASLAIMAATLLLKRQLFRTIYADVAPDVMANALTYLEITAVSYPFIALYNAGAALYRSMNRSRETMLVSMLVNAVNIAGNALCIYGMGMGVEGAAYPTLISRAVGAICMLTMLRNARLPIHLYPGAWRPRPDMLRRILNIGIPNGLENSLFQLGRVLVVRVITVFGTVQIAANAVANVADTLGVIPGQTMNLAIVTVVGQCVGAGDFQQARRYVRKLMTWEYAAMVVINVPLLLTLRYTLAMFAVSADTLELALILACIHNGMATLLWPLAFTLPNALRAANDVRYTMVVALGSMALFRIVFSYILGLGLGWGAIGVWIAMVLDWICRLTLYLIRYLGGRWERLARLT